MSDIVRLTEVAKNFVEDAKLIKTRVEKDDVITGYFQVLTMRAKDGTEYVMSFSDALKRHELLGFLKVAEHQYIDRLNDDYLEAAVEEKKELKEVNKEKVLSKLH